MKLQKKPYKPKKSMASKIHCRMDTRHAKGIAVPKLAIKDDK